jgi:hypothetical protein
MFAEMQMIDIEGAPVPAVPRSAVQTLGDRTVVYVVDTAQHGRFIERAVTLGKPSGDTVEVLSGVKSGEDVVAEGSFFVRAERERLSPSSAAAEANGRGVPTAVAVPSGSQAPSATTVKVTEQGFEPSRITVPKGSPAAVTFIRTADNTCAKEIVIPSQNVKRELPLNQPVTIKLKDERGEIAFVCGMNMFKGTVVVP